MDDNLYAITNLIGYATEMRQAAASSLSEEYEDDLDDYITVDEVIALVNEHCNGFDDEDRPLLDEDANAEIYESTITWMTNIGLAKLAAQDLVQCAWDDKANEMVFWANPQITKTKNKKRKSNDQSIKRRNKKKDTGS